MQQHLTFEVSQHVVIVDDDDLSLRLFGHIASEIPGVVTHCFLSSAEALEWCRGKDVDCFILDYHLPAPDGLEMIELLRAMDAFAFVPIVIVTGEHERQTRYRAFDAGANDFVEKPVDRRELVARVSTLLSLQHARKQLDAKIGSLETSLLTAERRTRRHAHRLEALWRIANNPTLHGQDLMLAMLRQAATTIRPRQRFRGVLSRIEGDVAVVVGVGIDPEDQDPGAERLKIGTRTPIEKTIIPRVSRSQGWDDLAVLPDIPEGAAALGWRSAITTQFDVAESRYSLTFASPEPTRSPFSAEDFAYLEVLASSFANQLQLNQLTESLRDEEERSRQHAARLEALWRIINNPSLRDDELLLAMLSQAASAIQPGQLYRGNLMRVQGDDLIIEVSAHRPEATEADAEAQRRVVPLKGSLIEKALLEGGGAHSWDDFQSPSSLPGRSRVWRAHLMTTFVAGGVTWVLSFRSNEAALKPLGSQEHSYIDVLASFFANHFQQRWQFDRIQYQQSHDVLTGLLNRSQFRSQARIASITAKRYAIVLIDINALREVNKSYGHMIGDALLVEVGNALRLRAAADEIVGRLVGDVFAIYIHNPSSKAFVRSRTRDFAQTFSHGFSTGDREGKEYISLTASLGVAGSPEDGTTIDEVLSRADAALLAAKERGPGSVVSYEAGMEALLSGTPP